MKIQRKFNKLHIPVYYCNTSHFILNSLVLQILTLCQTP